jgi:phenol 2-monooxygenase (NADPH)
MHPQILLRAADARPFELQDLLPADTRFKVLIFVGDPTTPEQKRRVEKLAEEMSRPESFLKKYTPGVERDTIFDVVAIASGTKAHVNYTAVPQYFRSHWSK